jgi:hypothetical protein
MKQEFWSNFLHKEDSMINSVPATPGEDENENEIIDTVEEQELFGEWDS